MSRVLVFSGDLLGSSRIGGAAARLGAEVETVADAEEVLRLARQESPRLVVVDLAAAGADLAELVGGLRALEPPPGIVAFGPHVHEGRLEAAGKAGCDEVLTRGQFHAQMDQVLARHLR